MASTISARARDLAGGSDTADATRRATPNGAACGANGAGRAAAGRSAPYPLSQKGGYGATGTAEAGVPPAGARHADGAAFGANGAAPGAWDATDALWDAELVVARLEEAGRTLLALPEGGYSTRLRQSRLAVMPNPSEGYGWEAVRARIPVPPAARITAMDEALAWIALIPEDRRVLRRIVGARALVHPLSERHLYPWRRLGALLGADHKAVQRWHKEAVGIIVVGLNRKKDQGLRP